jgi:hypothetical protein
VSHESYKESEKHLFLNWTTPSQCNIHDVHSMLNRYVLTHHTSRTTQWLATGPDIRDSVSGKGKIFLINIAHQHWPLSASCSVGNKISLSHTNTGPSQSPLQWVTSLSRGWSGHSVKLITHLHLMSRFRMVELYFHVTCMPLYRVA